jgi:hypothetical protein
MTEYRISFFKNLLSSDGHLFKCFQQAIEIRRARNAGRAIEAAERRYERLRHVADWKLCADALELDASGAANCSAETADRMVEKPIPETTARPGGTESGFPLCSRRASLTH